LTIKGHAAQYMLFSQGDRSLCGHHSRRSDDADGKSRVREQLVHGKLSTRNGTS
jgi:hypothetical protein